MPTRLSSWPDKQEEVLTVYRFERKALAKKFVREAYLSHTLVTCVPAVGCFSLPFRIHLITGAKALAEKYSDSIHLGVDRQAFIFIEPQKGRFGKLKEDVIRTRVLFSQVVDVSHDEASGVVTVIHSETAEDVILEKKLLIPGFSLQEPFCRRLIIPLSALSKDDAELFVAFLKTKITKKEAFIAPMALRSIQSVWYYF